MGDTVSRLAWFFIVCAAVSYALFLAVGSAINKTAIQSTRAVLARDSLQANVHHLSGMVMVPSTCAELSVRAQQLSVDTYELQFSTWQEPSLSSCEKTDTPRPFRAIVFAPAAGVNFKATLDGEPLLFSVIQVIDRS